MNIVHNIEDWGDRHHPKILDLIRMLLGLFFGRKRIYVFRKFSLCPKSDHRK